jgi:hypothetical protein
MGCERIANGTVDIGAYEAQQAATTTTVTASPATSVSGQSVTFTATVTPQAGSAIPVGSVQFQIDGSNFGSPVALVNGSATSAAISLLSVASHTIAGVYTSDSPVDFSASTGTTTITVEDATASNIQTVINNSPASSAGSVTIKTTSDAAVSAVVQGVNSATPSGAVAVTMDLGGGTYTTDTQVNAPPGVTLTIQNGTLIGGSPALVVDAGNVILDHVTALNATNAPTIVINGGSLVIRNSTIQESTGYAQSAIQITGGTVDLGTTASLGGNTFNVNGAGTVIQDSGGAPVPATGDVFQNNGVAIPANFGTVNLSAPAAPTANQGVAQPFNLGSLTDTVADSQSWAVDVNWGDGSGHTDFSATSTGPLSAQSHAFALPGTYTVTVAATDPVASGVSAWDLVETVTVTVTPSLLVLNPNASGALTLSANASITIPGAVVVDSSSTTAISAGGNAKLSAAVIDVTGGAQKSGNAAFSPAPTTGVSVPDPLVGLAGPSTTSLASYGPVSLSGNTQKTIWPGIYSQIAVSGNASLTLNPGTYIIEGGGFTVTGNASIAGTGVTIYNAGSNYPNTGGTFGGITLSGNGTFSLSAPTTGTYAGILIFQSRQDTRALSFSGNAMAGLSGTIYAANALLSMGGNAALTNPLIVGMLNLSGNVALTQTAAGSDGIGDTSGIANTLLAGDLSVYINDPSGLFTSDELARIQDAINAWDAILVPYNVTITEVSDPALANIVIDTSTNSACGGANNGVLGCYNEANSEITLIQGWNWYAGSDATQIGAGQYDFETTVLHELGHALGLGGSTDPNSPMYEVLASGVADRTVTTQDLNIPDPPEGADPQMAVGPWSVVRGPWSPAGGQAPAVGLQLSVFGFQPLEATPIRPFGPPSTTGGEAESRAPAPSGPYGTEPTAYWVSPGAGTWQVSAQTGPERALVVEGTAREPEQALTPSVDPESKRFLPSLDEDQQPEEPLGQPALELEIELNHPVIPSGADRADEPPLALTKPCTDMAIDSALHDLTLGAAVRNHGFAMCRTPDGILDALAGDWFLSPGNGAKSAAGSQALDSARTARDLVAAGSVPGTVDFERATEDSEDKVSTTGSDSPDRAGNPAALLAAALLAAGLSGQWTNLRKAGMQEKRKNKLFLGSRLPHRPHVGGRLGRQVVSGEWSGN